MAVTGQSSVERMMVTLHAMAGVRSMKDAMEMQTKLARSTARDPAQAAFGLPPAPYARPQYMTSAGMGDNL